MRNFAGKILALTVPAAAFISFTFWAGGAGAHPFDCMDNAYEASHEILSWQKYKACMAENFPGVAPDRRDYDSQAADLRKAARQAKLYRKMPDHAPIPLAAAARIVNLDGDVSDMSQCDYGDAKDAVEKAIPYMQGLDEGHWYYNQTLDASLFKVRQFYAAYADVCGVKTVILAGDKTMQSYINAGGGR